MIVEVKYKPMTTKEFSKLKSDLNYDIEKLVNDFVSECEKNDLTIPVIKIFANKSEVPGSHYFNVDIEFTV